MAQKKTFAVTALLVTALFVSGCGRTPKYLAPDFEDRGIRSLAVLPIEDIRDERLPVDERFYENFVDVLEDRDYTVTGPSKAVGILERSGVLEEDIHDLDAVELGDKLGVDGVFKSRLKDLADEYYGLARYSKLEMYFAVVDTADNAVVWRDEIDDSGTSFGLIVAAFPQVFEATRYVIKSLPEAE